MAGTKAALVGRFSELHAIEAALSAGAPATGAKVLQIAGEPGIGKSRLLTELCSRAAQSGHLVLAGRAAEFQRSLPYGVFADAMDGYLATLPQTFAEQFERDVIAELATAFTTFAAVAGRRPSAPQIERYRTCRAIRSLLERLAGGERSVVLVLDDVHWCDPASTDVLVHLLAYPPGGRVLVAVAFRPGQTQERLALALADALRVGTSTRLTLGPLTSAEADELMGSAVPGDIRKALYAESGGNPFYLEQLLRGRAGPRPGPHSPTITAGGVPETVAAALATELAALPADAARLLDGASVAGDPFDLEMAVCAAELDEHRGRQALDCLVAVELLRETTAPRHFRFRHPIVRRAVYEATGVGWRIEAHARLANALRAAGAAAAVVAPHLEHSAPTGDEAAVNVLVEAARTSSPRSPASAAHWLGAALRLLPEGGAHGPRRLPLLAERAIALAASGQIEESHRTLAELLERLPPDAPGRIGLIALCANLECLLGRARQALGRLERALSELTDDGSAEAVTFQIELSVTSQWANEPAAAAQWARRAYVASRSLGDPALEAAAAVGVGFAAYDEANLAEVESAVERATYLIDSLDDPSLAARLDAPYYLTWMNSLLERFDDALRVCQRAIHVSRSMGHGQWLLPLVHAGVWPLMWQGHLAEAERQAGEAVEAAFVADDRTYSAMTLYARCLVAVLSGDIADAVRFGERSVEFARGIDHNEATALTSMALGMALLEAGQPERAREEILAGARGPGLPSLKGVMKMNALETLVRAELALGRIPAAEHWAGRADDVAGRWPFPLALAGARRAQGLVLLAQRETQTAVEVVLPAVDTVAPRSLLEAGRTRLLVGRALALAGRRTAAESQLELAEQELARCGAHGYRAQARSELDSLRRLPHDRDRRGHSGLDSLTTRERQIAELVSTGRTNREIAETCHLSEKTIERHLSHIFEKLGASTRAGVAGIVARTQG